MISNVPSTQTPSPKIKIDFQTEFGNLYIFQIISLSEYLAWYYFKFIIGIMKNFF